MTSITPPELHGLLAIAREEGLDMKPVLLRVLTDLYIAVPAHSSDEVAQFREIAGTLAAQVDTETAMVVACKLAGYAHTPHEVGEAILDRGDDSSRILLADARWISASTLITQAAVGDRMMAAAVAARAHLDPDLVRLLLDRHDPLIDVTLAANTALVLPTDVRDALLERARDEEALAVAMLARTDLTGADRSVLFLAADRETRARIIDDAERLAGLSARPRAPRIASEDLVASLETAALYDDGQSFAQILSLALGAAPDKARRLLADRSGEALALALVALGVPEETSARIFMFRDPLIGHSTERVRALVDLTRRISPGAAERLVVAMLGGGRAQPRSGSHVPGAAPADHVRRHASTQQAAAAPGAPAQRRVV
ncbi:hypothetical protein SLNSH_13690 [Alsobacter soli]|uniref:DUF2336 domain-containing protein n=1 Tax=Alsobacter soli TaxID=2109933 RepID=A0A2T1HSA6_9HYPH|nr:DUF2336 domain-containing protein [Alsobacter soli]PSC04543.1 hypothetical protein SLNSH_13690 [Alsobacter soli]